uniref:Uncharacterized protein n=1 Tax=Spermophilus dauricus TaxID=99837 RepID=A0A8C9P785_SPEDA
SKEREEGSGDPHSLQRHYSCILNVSVALHKTNNLAEAKEIEQECDHAIIWTLSTFRKYIMDFYVEKEFKEDPMGIDNTSMTTVIWNGDKLQCNKLYLEMRVESMICKQGIKKVHRGQEGNQGTSGMTIWTGSLPLFVQYKKTSSHCQASWQSLSFISFSFLKIKPSQ